MSSDLEANSDEAASPGRGSKPPELVAAGADEDVPTPWRVGPRNVAYMSDGVLQLLDGSIIEDSGGFRAPRRPNRWPASPSSLFRWIDKADPAVVALVLSEAAQPLIPKAIQERLVEWQLLNPDEAQPFWKRVSRKLSREPTIERSGPGSKRYSFVDVVKGGASAPTSPLAKWLFGEVQSPPVYRDISEAERLVLSQLATVVDAAHSGEAVAQPGHWSVRLRRTRLLLEMKPKVSERLTEAVDTCLHMILADKRPQPDEVVLELLEMWLLQHAGVDVDAQPRVFFSLVRFRHRLRIPPSEVDRLGAGWSDREWVELVTLAKSLVDDLSIADLIRLLRHSLLRGHTPASQALLTLVSGRPGLGRDAARWEVLAQLATPLSDEHERVVDYLDGVLRLIMDQPAGDLASEAFQRLMHRLVSDTQEEIEASVAEARENLRRQEAEARRSIEAAKREEAALMVRMAEAEERKRQAEHEVTVMAGRLEEAGSRGVAEAKVQAWRVVAETLESLLDRAHVDPDGIGRAVRRLEGELAVAGVRPTAQRGELVPFDSSRYEWLSGSEPTERVEVLKRPYEIRHRGTVVVLLRGLVRGRQ